MTLHIDVRGEGPDLVLIHGWAMNGAIWNEIATDLSQNYRLHIVDLPGHGNSAEQPLNADLDAVSAVLCAHLPPRAHWLGWSLGGTIALHTALMRPERVARLVIVGATPRFLSAPDWPHGVALDTFAQFTDDLANDFAATLQRFLMLQTLGNKDARRSTMALARALAGRPAPNADTLQAGLALLQQTQLERDVGQIRAPTLIIHGVTDRLVPIGAAQYLARVMPHATLHSLAGTGHAPFISRRAAFVAAITEFLS